MTTNLTAEQTESIAAAPTSFAGVLQRAFEARARPSKPNA